MTDEVKTPVEGQVEGEAAPAAPEYTEIEVRAMEMGWRPKTEFNGNEDDFVDAKEFVGRKPLFDKLDAQGRHLKVVSRALEQLKTHYTMVNEAAYERALADLKTSRREALTNGDGDKFEQLDDQIKLVEEQKQQLQAVKQNTNVQENVVHPEFQSWKSRNQWYDTVPYMRNYADTVGVQFNQQGMTPSEVLKKVEEAVRKEFPNKFHNANKDAAPHVESAVKTGVKSNKAESQLSDIERKMMNDLVRAGVLTKDKYLADLAKIKGQV
jgi:hypothetical protein